MQKHLCRMLDFWILLGMQGHKIKNPKSEIYKALRTIPVDCRIILTGTPIQNNLMEAHSLFDFACKASEQTWLAALLPAV